MEIQTAQPSSLCSLPLQELQRLLAQGEIAPLDLVNEAIRCAEALAPFHSLISLDEARARAQALICQGSQLAKRNASGLWGLPVSVKDLIDLADETTTCGSSFYARTCPRPREDAAHASRWKDAGAVLMGKSNCAEFSYAATGSNLHYGDCLNPLYPERLTGGSSSGAAGTVLGGAACIGIGTDTGGSLRIPASLSSLVGFRSSVHPEEWRGTMHLAPTLDAFGWLNRHLGDVLMIGRSLYPSLPAPLLPEKMRFAKMTGAWLDVCEPPVLDAFDAFCEHLQEFGFTVQETPALGWNDANEIRQHITAYEAFEGHREFLAQHRAEYDSIILKRLEFGGTLSHETYTQYLTRKELFSWKLDDAFYEVDFLLAPTVPVSKVLPGEYANDGFLITLTSAASVAGLPVLTVPWKENQHKGGIGFQIMARKEHDAALFVLADKLSKCY